MSLRGLGSFGELEPESLQSRDDLLRGTNEVYTPLSSNRPPLGLFLLQFLNPHLDVRDIHQIASPLHLVSDPVKSVLPANQAVSKGLTRDQREQDLDKPIGEDRVHAGVEVVSLVEQRDLAPYRVLGDLAVDPLLELPDVRVAFGLQLLLGEPRAIREPELVSDLVLVPSLEANDLLLRVHVLGYLVHGALDTGPEARVYVVLDEVFQTEANTTFLDRSPIHQVSEDLGVPGLLDQGEGVDTEAGLNDVEIEPAVLSRQTLDFAQSPLHGLYEDPTELHWEDKRSVPVPELSQPATVIVRRIPPVEASGRLRVEPQEVLVGFNEGIERGEIFRSLHHVNLDRTLHISFNDLQGRSPLCSVGLQRLQKPVQLPRDDPLGVNLVYLIQELSNLLGREDHGGRNLSIAQMDIGVFLHKVDHHITKAVWLLNGRREGFLEQVQGEIPFGMTLERNMDHQRDI